MLKTFLYSIHRKTPNSSCIFNRLISSKRILNVAIVGRPNTGKSTLFNRLTRSNAAIVSNVPGTTRDRREGSGMLVGLPLKVIDTGGLDDRGLVSINIQEQVIAAIKHADVILFMLDARSGVTSVDEHFAKWLRIKLSKSKVSENLATSSICNLNDSTVTSEATEMDRGFDKELIVVANKTEGSHLSDQVLNTVADAFALGLGEPLLISASHGDGMSDIAEALIKIAQKRGYNDGSIDSLSHTKEKDGLSDEDKVIQLAVMGRPNVGKSTLINAFIGEERVITGPVAGLTRDSINVEWNYEGRKFRLVDTAGLTRLRTNKELLQSNYDTKRGKIIDAVGTNHLPSVKLPGIQSLDPEIDPSQFSSQLSEMSLISALNALRFAQVVLIVVESTQGNFSKVDMQLARKCLQEGRGIVIAANKQDLLTVGKENGETVSFREYEKSVKKHANEFIRDFGDIPVVACSGLEKHGIKRILKAVLNTYDAWSKRIDTGILNRWLKDMMVSSPMPRSGNKSINIKYVTQVKSRPPTFALFTNVSEIPIFFERFLRTKIQHDFSLFGVPIRFIVHKTKGNAVNRNLLKQGKHTRRGIGRGETRGVGPNRVSSFAAKKAKGVQMLRRKRDSRLSRVRK
eukprot:gene4256-6035_t